MRNLVFLFIASVAMTFAACGCQTASEKNVNDSDSVAVIDSLASDSLVVDSLVPDSAVAE